MSVRGTHGPYGANSLQEDEEEAYRRGEPSNTPMGSSKVKKDKSRDSVKYHELQRLLLYEERESRHLRATLKETIQRLEMEMARADNAELRTREAIAKTNSTETSRQGALAEAAKANEELRLYKIQYTNIQKELERAQSEYDKMAELKQAAENVANQAKQEIRRMSMEREIERARVEAKREGLEEGYRRGKQEGMEEGQYQEQQRATQAYERVVETNHGQSLRSLAQFAEEYFRSPHSRTLIVGTPQPLPVRPDTVPVPQRPTETSKLGVLVPDAAQIVDNLPIRIVTTPILQPDVGRQANVNDSNSYNAPPSIRNTPASPVFHGSNIDPGYIPSLDDGRIGLPPPHEIDPNPALSPTPSTANLVDSQRSLEEEGGYFDNGALPLQTSRQTARRSRPPDGASPPAPSSSSSSTHVSNFPIVRDTVDLLNQDAHLSGSQRGIPYRNAVSPGLSAIPEGSNIDASSPDSMRRSQDIDPEPRALSPTRRWSAVGGRWSEQPDDRDVTRNDLGYSNPRETSSRMNMRDEIRSSPSNTGPPHIRPVAVTPTPFIATVEDLSEGPVFREVNSQLRNKRRSVASGRVLETVSGRGSPASDHHRILSQLEGGFPSQVQDQARISNGSDSLPEISILPPSRSPSFKEVPNPDTPMASPMTQPFVIPATPPHRSPSPTPIVNSSTRPITTASPALANQDSIPTSNMGFFVPISGANPKQPFEVERARSPHISRSADLSRAGIPIRSGAPSTNTLPDTMGIGRVPTPIDPSSRSRGIQPEIFAPTPRRPRPPSIGSPVSDSPHSRNIILPLERHRRTASELIGTASVSSGSASEGHPGSRQSTMRSPSGLRRSVSEHIANSPITRSSARQTYPAANIPEGVVYPTPLDARPQPPPGMLRGILKNSQTPGTILPDLPDPIMGPFSGAGSSYRVNPVSPVPSIQDPPPPQYKAAPTPDNVNYPRSPIAPAEPLTTFVPSPMAPRRSPAARTLEAGRSPIATSSLKLFPRSPAIGTRVVSAQGRVDDGIDDDEIENPVHPSTSGMGIPMGTTGSAGRTPGRTPGHTPARQAPNLTEQWMAVPLPPSANPGSVQLPISTAPSIRSLGQNGPWHPSQHLTGSGGSQKPSPAINRSPRLPPFTGTPQRPWRIR